MTWKERLEKAAGKAKGTERADESDRLDLRDCPHDALLGARLAEALAGRTGVTLTRTVSTDAADAARHGMHGSPTLLIDGRDPFATPGAAAALACRLYQAENGRLEGSPATAALRQALARASRT